jgi:hypothetical protein
MSVITTSIIFEPNDGMLTQLRNSGSLRYFKNVHLQTCISNISVAILNARDRNAQEYRFIEDFMRPFTLKHFDFNWLDEYTHGSKVSILEAIKQSAFHPSVVPVIKNPEQFKREDAEGLASYYLVLLRATRQIHYAQYVQKNHELLQALRDEYGFGKKRSGG